LISPKQKRKQKITASREETAAKPQRMLLVLGPDTSTIQDVMK